MKVLVTGGAGYIGSHTVVELVQAGMTPVIVDNFSNSRREVLGRLEQIVGQAVECHEADVTDRAALKKIVEAVKPDAAIHFAGWKAVGESVKKPLLYYRNNLLSTIVLAEVLQEAGVKQIIFSSSATVYGDPDKVPIPETAALRATNPYGQTKLMNEQILKDVAVADNAWKVTLLRYFNPVGAHESGLIGEDPQGVPNNLMPFVAQVAAGRREKLSVFGNDYDTPDGTGVRDYLHVVDLAQAHVKAVQHLDQQSGVAVYNLGTGKGYSVLDMVKAFERASGKKIPYEIVARRPGDIATCYADPTLAGQELGWKANKTLVEMCADTWHWQSTNPNGYEPGQPE
jgi:UDP-glucose 4-epimerase